MAGNDPHPVRRDNKEDESRCCPKRTAPGGQIKKKKIACLALTENGRALAEKIAAGLDGEVFFCRGRLKKNLTRCWQEYDALVCIMATGIVVRTLAPLLRDKAHDPAVLVCDEKGQFVISLLSGHIGGGNRLAREVADITGGTAVITTASDVQGRTPLDLFLRDLGVRVGDRAGLTRIMGKLVNQGWITIASDYPLPPLPDDLRLVDAPDEANLYITARSVGKGRGVLAHPPVLAAGIGCNRNTPASEIREALQEACAAHNLALASVFTLASIDLKKDEDGLLAVARGLELPIRFYDRDELNGVAGVSVSQAVLKATGAKGVAEPAAILASSGGRLLVRKMKWANVTVAIAETMINAQWTMIDE